ncbi:hypothetical protein ACFXJ8_07850 [Nonomuraea sp. NPDC059194]|uniref:hypothetical protein n=1 Tax=Nonomuraea sp. NPDC059194 TaxID=3346764 RepID=UPI0036CC9EAA
MRQERQRARVWYGTPAALLRPRHERRRGPRVGDGSRRAAAIGPFAVVVGYASEDALLAALASLSPPWWPPCTAILASRWPGDWWSDWPPGSGGWCGTTTPQASPSPRP